MIEVPPLFKTEEALDDKEKARRRKQNQRDRQAGRPETYPPQKEDKEHREQTLALLEELKALDETEKYYHKSECRSRAELLHWYCAFAYGKKILREERTYQDWLDLRDKCRTDLFSLAKEFLGYKDLVSRVHQPVCDMFVKKDFTNTFHAEYEREDIRQAFWRMRKTRKKDALILYPRNTFKSCIDIADIVQWLLACPDVKVLLLTAEMDRARSFIVSIKRFFAEGTSDYNDLQLLFPEYVLRGIDSTSMRPIDCPARKDALAGLDANFWVKSQSSQKTGSHADVIKRDDIVTPENATKPELREAVKESADDTENLLMKHGFLDTIGTRYAGGIVPDYYGIMLQRDENAKKEFGESDLVYLVGKSWIVKPEHAHLPLARLEFHMVDLLFPEEADTPERAFKSLRKQAFNNERMFRNQQLNEPIDDEEEGDFNVSFTDMELRARMYHREEAPKNGDVIISWDWSLGDKKTNDYSVGVVARRYKNGGNEWCFVILEIVFGKWKHSELAYQIVSLYKKWNPARTIIEASNASDYLREDIKALAQREMLLIESNIWWKPPSREENAKRNRIKGLEILLRNNRLHFVLGSWIDETFKQFTQYTGEKKNKGRKDDIPDAVSYLIYLLPPSVRFEISKNSAEEEQQLEEEQIKAFQKASQYDRIFGQRLATSRRVPGQDFLEGQNPQASTWRERLGQGKPEPAAPEPVPPKPQDPRMVIFGNKGPWRL